MRRRQKTVMAVVALTLLVVSGLGCSFCPLLDGRETPPPQPPPVVTQEATTIAPGPPPHVPEGMTALEHPFGGVNLHYPADWEAEVSAEGVLLAESQQVLDDFDPAAGALMLVFSGVAEEMTADVTGEPTAEGLMDTMLAGFEDTEGNQMGERETRRFASQEGMGAPLWWSEEDQSLRGYLAAYLDEDVGAILLAITSEDQWDETWPSFDAILASATFYAPLEAVDRGGIELNGTDTSTLDAGGTDGWTYRSPGDEYVTVEVVAVGDWDPTLEVFNEAGNSVAFDDDSGDGFNPRLVGLHLPVPGRYEIRVSTYSGHGEYQITLSAAETPGGGSLTYGETVESNLEEEGEQETWTFEGVAGDAISISMVGLGSLRDTYLELHGPDGTRLTHDDDSGEGTSALIGEYRLPQTGTYRIVARAYGSQAGSYTLTLMQVEIEERTIAYGQTLSGELTAEHPRQYWLFDGAAGDEVTISMVGLGSLSDTYLELYAPDGTLLTQNDDSGEGFFALIEDYHLPTNGTYRIIARGFGSAVGQYELSLERSP